MKKGLSQAGKCMILALSLTSAVPTVGVAIDKAEVASVQQQQISRVQMINPTTVEVIFANGQTMTFDFYGQNIFRVFQDNAGGIIRDPKAKPEAQILVNTPRRAVGGVTVKEEQGFYSIATPRIDVKLCAKSGLMSVYDCATGECVIEEVAAKEFTEKKTTITLAGRADEYFYGGGVQNGRFSHKGKQIAIENSNNWVDGGVASPTPFYWSTKGYGVMWHTFKKGTYDFGSKAADKVVLSHEENYLDVFFMVNATPQDLLGDFYQLTGNPVLLPKFGFYMGHLNAYNRDYWTEVEKPHRYPMAYEDGKQYNESQKDNGGIKESLNGELPGNYQFSARAALDRYLDNDLPLGWFLPNDGYGAGYGQTETLDGNIQNLKEFGDYARAKGVEIGLWTQSDLHPKEGIEALLQRDIVKEVRDAGVRVLKTDVAWVGAGYSFGLNGVADVGQIMPYYGSNARPFIISLDGWAGTQRYAGIWSGDQTGGEWEYIRFHIPTFIGSGLSGQPNITSDVDGIFGGVNIPVNVREYQWKTWTPMELNMDGWGANPKYPQALGEPATSINRWYMKLKAALMPYAYSIAREAVDGKPMIRAMFLEYPNEYTLGVATQYQYLFGPSFLVAPIYKDTKMDEKGNDIRNGIYLPEGTWVDYFNGDVYEGGCIINNYDCPLWKLPVFVKGGSIIPMNKPHNTPMEVANNWRGYEIYATEGATFNEYDDDGKTQEYLYGRNTTTPISTTVEGKKLTINIGATTGDFEGFNPNKATEIRINATAAPKKVVLKVGKKKITLKPVANVKDLETHHNFYCFEEAPNLNQFATPGSEFAKEVITKNSQIVIFLAKYDITASDFEIIVDGFEFKPADHLKKSHGTLAAPKVNFTEENIKPYDLAPSWEKVENADFYEVEFQGMRYSTITDLSLNFEALEAETAYEFKVRAVNADGASEWTTAKATTLSNPLEFAIQGIKATVTCEDQPGQTIAKLFDFDMKSGWHTKWGKGEAVPFDMVIDLRTLNQLDRFEYYHREDGGNGTILEGTIAYSSDKQNWSEPEAFSWPRLGAMVTHTFKGNPTARYIKISVTNAAGNFGSGHELYVYKVEDTESVLQGDINRDKRIDDNDLTSYMNYTGLRTIDGDFDYVSIGDVNANGLIDAFDISVVSTELDGGVRASNAKVAGSLELTPNANAYKAGDIVEIKVSGKDLNAVNALGFGLPYNTAEFEYVGVELVGMKNMVNLTYDRLHSNGQKALYPTFVNRGNNFLLDNGSNHLFTIKFKAKKAGKFNLKAVDGILVDRNLGTVTF